MFVSIAITMSIVNIKQTGSIYSFIFAQLLSITYALPGNSILEAPEVHCETSRILVKLKTEKSFNGRLYLKGNSHQPECTTDFTESQLQNNTLVQFAVDYNMCNTERIRQLEPSGVTYANTVVVQFHRIFITTGDKAYHIRCFYSELDQKVTSEIDVSMIPTGTVQQEMDLPECSYTVRRGTANGPLVRSAKVGDQVYHRWECTGNKDGYGMLVHSCFVEDSSGEREEILDDRGCTRDQLLLPNLQYNDDQTLAYSQSQVFKYPDNSFIYFRCQIRLCTKIDDSCNGLSPPSCSRRKARSLSLPGNSLNSTRNATLTFDVMTKEILVLDENDDFTSGGLSDSNFGSSVDIYYNGIDHRGVHNPNQSLAWSLCTNRLLLVSIFLGFFMFFSGSVIFIVYLMVKNRQKGVSSISE